MPARLSITTARWLSIYKLCPYATVIVTHNAVIVPPNRHDIIPHNAKTRPIKYSDLPTHEVWLHGQKWHESAELADPNTDVGIFLTLGAGTAINRPSNSSLLLYQDIVYQFLTWQDILGEKKYANAPRRVRDNHLICYLSQLPDRQSALVQEAYRDYVGTKRLV